MATPLIPKDPSHSLKIVLYNPQIPGNTGSIGRTCVALNIELILIKPLGFDLSEKAVRRAGLDYWKYVRVREFDSFAEFIEGDGILAKDLFFLSRFATESYYKANFTANSVLIFGAETTGLPETLWKKYGDQFYFIPTFSPHIRSLNLANSVTAVAYESIRQLFYLR